MKCARGADSEVEVDVQRQTAQRTLDHTDGANMGQGDGAEVERLLDPPPKELKHPEQEGTQTSLGREDS